MTLSLFGNGITRGVARGRAYLLDSALAEIPEYAVTDVPAEVRRFTRALTLAQRELAAIKERIPESTPLDIREFIDTHVLMLEDQTLSEPVVELIRSEQRNAEWALRVQRENLVKVFEQMDDPYLATRKDDIDHVVSRIQRKLRSPDEEDGEDERIRARHKGAVIVADDVAAADLALLAHEGAVALVTEYGSPLSHTAILARSLRLPTVLGVPMARSLLQADEEIIVDGSQGVVLAEPSVLIEQVYFQQMEADKARQRNLTAFSSRPSRTADGVDLTFSANIELAQDIELAVEAGAEGVGLYRTEFLYLGRSEAPGEEEQLDVYADVLDRLQGRPLTIRTIDLGADKQWEGMQTSRRVNRINPALGLRAIRLCLREPELFRPQVRAILRASALGPVRLMVPMLTSIEELFTVRKFIQAERRKLEVEGAPMAADVPLGAMVEVPAAALAAPVFAKHLDFLSLGTNDLIQYTLAIDRVDDEVSYLFDPLNPAVLSLIHQVIMAGREQHTPVSMCGEMAGDTAYTRLLLGMGLREFSMHPSAILEVKQIALGTEVAAMAKPIADIMKTVNAVKLHERVRQLDQAGHPGLEN